MIANLIISKTTGVKNNLCIQNNKKKIIYQNNMLYIIIIYCILYNINKRIKPIECGTPNCKIGKFSVSVNVYWFPKERHLWNSVFIILILNRRYPGVVWLSHYKRDSCWFYSHSEDWFMNFLALVRRAFSANHNAINGIMFTIKYDSAAPRCPQLK